MQEFLKKPRFALYCLALATLSACGDQGEEAKSETSPPGGDSPAAANPGAAFLPASDENGAACNDGGELQTELYGALAGKVEWRLGEMQCQGMPRPDGQGARLRFAGTVGADQTPLSFIVGIPGLVRGATDSELPSNVTVIDGGSARFFNTADLDACWTDVAAQTPIDDAAMRVRIDGVVYCIDPLPEVNGAGSVSLSELKFSGQLEWGTK